MINNFIMVVTFMTYDVQVRLLISWHEYVQECYEVHACVTKWSTRGPKCTLINDRRDFVHNRLRS